MNLKILENVLGAFRPEAWLVIGVLLIVAIVNKLTNRKKNLPPGPVGLPVVGYLPFLTKCSHLKFIKLGEKYGNIFSLYLGSQFAVVLNDADVIREAFSKRELLARPSWALEVIGGFHSAFFGQNLKEWQEQRRFVLHTLRDLGLGKSKLEGHIQDEIQYFLKLLGQSKGKPIDIAKPLISSMSNNVCALVFGERYDYDNPVRIDMDDVLENLTVLTRQTGPNMFFPWLTRMTSVAKFTTYKEGTEAVKRIMKFIGKKIREHWETLDPNNIRDLIDGYLLEMKKVENDPDTSFTEHTLKGNLLNFFNAGSETPRTTISWCMYIVAAYQEVQKKMQKEIDEVLGPDKFPKITDQKDMPYTQAVIREIMRWKTVVPLNVLRYCVSDVDVGGYTIPQGAVVIGNLWSAHHDPKDWKDPEVFRPERFLNSDGTVLKSNNFMPFSVGKRSCPAENMAMMEVFLYFVAILQTFHVSFPEGYTPDFKAKLSATWILEPFEICFNRK